MWRTAEVQPRQDRHLTSPVLICTFADSDSRPAQVEKERFSLIHGYQGHGDSPSEVWVIPFSLVNAALLHCHERVRFCLIQIRTRHQETLSFR